MSLIVWKEIYSVNNAEIDSQHKKLIGLINTLYQISKDNKNDKIPAVIEEIRDYSVYHFKTEESVFKEINYLNSDDHIDKHKKFSNDLDLIIKQYGNSPTILTVKAFTFLQRWLTEHIMTEDKKYAPFLLHP